MATLMSAVETLCPPDQFLLLVDRRLVGRLLTNAPDGTPIRDDALELDDSLNAHLRQASGDIESAAYRGHKYAPEDLTALSVPDVNGKFSAAAGKLFGLITDLTMTFLMERRDRTDTPEYTRRAERAYAWLAALEGGSRIFGHIEHADAGTLASARLTADEIQCQEILISVAHRWFGTRSNRLHTCSGSGDGSLSLEE